MQQMMYVWVYAIRVPHSEYYYVLQIESQSKKNRTLFSRHYVVLVASVLPDHAIMLDHHFYFDKSYTNTYQIHSEH